MPVVVWASSAATVSFSNRRGNDSTQTPSLGGVVGGIETYLFNSKAEGHWIDRALCVSCVTFSEKLTPFSSDNLMKIGGRKKGYTQPAIYYKAFTGLGASN